MRKRLFAAAALCLCGIAIYFAVYSIGAITANAPYERLESLPTIVIDAGHAESVHAKNAVALKFR